MKSILRLGFLMLVGVLLVNTSFSQDKSQRASPPAEATGMVGDAKVMVNYSSPAVKGRTIFGDLVPNGEIWRAGANEATTIEVSKDVMVEGEKLAAGKYSLFTIPGEEEWTIIFNTVPEQWGAYKYDEKKDALRVTVKPQKSAEFAERLEYLVVENGIILQWENTKVPVTIK